MLAAINRGILIVSRIKNMLGHTFHIYTVIPTTHKIFPLLSIRISMNPAVHASWAPSSHLSEGLPRFLSPSTYDSYICFYGQTLISHTLFMFSPLQNFPKYPMTCFSSHAHFVRTSLSNTLSVLITPYNSLFVSFLHQSARSNTASSYIKIRL